MSTTPNSSTGTEGSQPNITKGDVRAAERSAEAVGSQHGGLVSDFAGLGMQLERERFVLDSLASSFAAIGQDADPKQIREWCNTEADRLAELIEYDETRLGRGVSDEGRVRLNDHCWRVVGGLARSHLLDVRSERVGISSEAERNGFLESVGDYQKATAKARSLARARATGSLRTMHGRMRSSSEAMEANGAEFGNLVGDIGQVADQIALPAYQVAAWGVSYRRDVLAQPGDRMEAARADWVEREAEAYLASAARGVDRDDENNQELVRLIMLALAERDVFGSSVTTGDFVTALTKYKASEDMLRKAESDFWGKSGTRAVLTRLGLGVGSKLKDIITSRDIKESRLPARVTRVGRAMGLAAVAYTVLNRAYVGIEHGLDAAFSFNHWTFDFLEHPWLAGKADANVNESAGVAAGAALESHPDSHPQPSAAASDTPTAQPSPASSPASTPEVPGRQGDMPAGAGGTGAEAQPGPVFTTSMEAGGFGGNGNPGSLSEFAELVLAEHGITNPTQDQLSAVTTALIDSNENYGSQHGINEGQSIDLRQGHIAADALLQPAEQPGVAEANQGLPEDWPANADGLSEQQVEALNVPSGGGGYDLVEGLGYDKEDWDRVAPALHEARPDLVYAVDASGNEVAPGQDTPVAAYRLKKQGYPPWSFIETLFELLNKRS